MSSAATAEVVGILASTISFILGLPQAVQVWRNRRSPDRLGAISVPTQLLVVTNASLWGLYAVLLHAFWVGAPGLINGPLAIATIVIVRRARARQASQSPAASGCSQCGWDDPRPHLIKTTRSAGAGTLVPCYPGALKSGHPVPAPA